MLLNCSQCGKEVYIPDSWTRSSQDYQPILCGERKKQKASQ